MVVLCHGDIMKEAYEFLRYGVLNEEGHFFNFAHKDGICEDSGVENACIVLRLTQKGLGKASKSLR